MLLDQQTNLVSYIDALDAVTIPKFPVKAPLTIISTLWQRGSETQLEMRVRVYAPDGKHLIDAVADPLAFRPEHKRGRMSVGVAGFEISGPGRYEFGVETREKGKWVEVHRIPMDVDAARPVAAA
ncbi:MAG: hypothetical protein K2X99_06185 [Gemmatimonadaceae bacterium]|nr:hypothetical protein [Gemmatimonadaceae bacterium]